MHMPIDQNIRRLLSSGSCLCAKGSAGWLRGSEPVFDLGGRSNFDILWLWNLYLVELQPILHHDIGNYLFRFGCSLFVFSIFCLFHDYRRALWKLIRSI